MQTISPPKQFGIVESGVYRCAYPRTLAQVNYLRSLRPQTILQLSIEAIPRAVRRALEVPYAHSPFSANNFGSSEGSLEVAMAKSSAVAAARNGAVAADNGSAAGGGASAGAEGGDTAVGSEKKAPSASDAAALPCVANPHSLTVINTIRPLNQPIIIDLSPLGWEQGCTLSSDVVAQALEYVLDASTHPVVLMGPSGELETSAVVCGLRLVQQWSLSAIVGEAALFASAGSQSTRRLVEFTEQLELSREDYLPQAMTERRNAISRAVLGAIQREHEARMVVAQQRIERQQRLMRLRQRRQQRAQRAREQAKRDKAAAAAAIMNGPAPAATNAHVDPSSFPSPVSTNDDVSGGRLSGHATEATSGVSPTSPSPSPDASAAVGGAVRASSPSANNNVPPAPPPEGDAALSQHAVAEDYDDDEDEEDDEESCFLEEDEEWLGAGGGGEMMGSSALSVSFHSNVAAAAGTALPNGAVGGLSSLGVSAALSAASGIPLMLGTTAGGGSGGGAGRRQQSASSFGGHFKSSGGAMMGIGGLGGSSLSLYTYHDHETMAHLAAPDLVPHEHRHHASSLQQLLLMTAGLHHYQHPSSSSLVGATGGPSAAAPSSVILSSATANNPLQLLATLPKTVVCPLWWAELIRAHEDEVVLMGRVAVERVAMASLKGRDDAPLTDLVRFDRNPPALGPKSKFSKVSVAEEEDA